MQVVVQSLALSVLGWLETFDLTRTFVPLFTPIQDVVLARRPDRVPRDLAQEEESQ